MLERIVISRYNEDIEWLKILNNRHRILIYNKGKPIKFDFNLDIKNIKNVGREAHTWIYHIYHNYEILDKKTLFLQGRIDDLDCMVFKNLDDYFLRLEKSEFCASRLGLLTPFHWKDNLNIENDDRYREDWKAFKIGRNSEGFRSFAKNLFGKVPIFIPTSYGGCFSVRKEAILSYPRSFYLKLLENLERHIHPIEAHYLERLWYFMFSKKLSYRNAFIDVIKTKIERNILIK